MTEENPKQMMDAALEISRASRKVILGFIESGFSASVKADKTFVTEADLQAELAIRKEIERRFPAHGILGEEFEARNPQSDYQWIIDPIDGTLSFKNGIPLYGTILSLHYRGEGIVGLIDHPSLDRVFHAAKGAGAFCNGSPLRIPPCAEGGEKDEIVACGDRLQFTGSGDEKCFEQMMSGHPYVRTYSDCFGHTLAASGAVGAMVDFGLKDWDVSATRVLIEEAGGKFLCLRERVKRGLRLFDVIFGKHAVVDYLQREFFNALR